MSSLLLLLCTLLTFQQFPAQVSLSPSPVIFLSVNKDAETLQYVTRIYQGHPPAPIKLVVDLGSPFLWADCASSGSSRLVLNRSLQCSKAMAFDPQGSKIFLSKSDNLSTCDLSTGNSITWSKTRGEVVEDVLTLRSLQGTESGSIIKVKNFLFSCVPTFLLSGLASGSKGMLGLARSQIGLPLQISALIGSERKFFTCLSSSNGVVLLGDAPIDTIFGSEFSRSLMYTPLVIYPRGSTSGSSQEYFINVKSIRINNRRVSFNLKDINGGTKLSTIVPYTTLESSIYDTFSRAYELAANSMNMTIVAPVAPFGLCFSSGRIAMTPLGPAVPKIDLVLQSEMVKWRIIGRNSMVQVSDEVTCLGFLDGGSMMDHSQISIVIGGLQLEDNLVEFNLATNMLGFSMSPLMRHTSCSNFMSGLSIHSETL